MVWTAKAEPYSTSRVPSTVGCARAIEAEPSAAASAAADVARRVLRCIFLLPGGANARRRVWFLPRKQPREQMNDTAGRDGLSTGLGRCQHRATRLSIAV